ncbi:Glucosamine-6-phosphate deaminase [Sinomonas atrocyanea]|uniref:Glucosamine-6-phosphate deaminase n=1 Tax=Sinomonas atrocyanea TaxID=37927 RepID=A0A127A1Y7_9MICC|nr:glucosamine-6-phosphate deaminase [Sinomonas atrocyanea]AMM31662.1 Glucosamine-6-phosphate deaminase [Sinomonas atrocyanea]GEB65351.1 glucosamine-6-phosphate deaminase [Sinomonas atrocyanea]GGG58987.1 glucosamine-6-phosphate deaminase [Sinomonas atrocyanea]
MDLIIADTPSQLGEDAAALITDQVRRQPNTVLGLATGSSPLPVYEHLGRHRGTDFSSVTCFALDEYVGVAAEHPQSYRRFIADRIAGPLGIAPGRVHVPAGDAQDLDAACAAFEESIAEAGGVDLQILGIGRNGHLAFNEPGSAFSSRTRPVRLTEDTRRVNARFFDSLGHVPTHAVTQGLATIMEARRLLLVAQGADKAAALVQALEGPVTEAFPASIIQRHPHATVIADSAAAALLNSASAATVA